METAAHQFALILLFLCDLIFMMHSLIASMPDSYCIIIYTVSAAVFVIYCIENCWRFNGDECCKSSNVSFLFWIAVRSCWFDFMHPFFSRIQMMISFPWKFFRWCLCGFWLWFRFNAFLWLIRQFVKIKNELGWFSLINNPHIFVQYVPFFNLY